MVIIEFKGRETNQINSKETKLSQNRKRNADPEKLKKKSRMSILWFTSRIEKMKKMSKDKNRDKS